MASLAALVAAAALLPGFAPVGSGPAGGLVLAGRFPGTVRPGYVYLPPSFSTARRYPVVYLLHGMPGAPSEYLDGTRLLQVADRAPRPFVAVLPAAGPSVHYDGEWAGTWESDLVERIVPWIDRRLPTDATPAGRVIAGLSAGGYGAVDIGLRHPGVFGTIESWGGYFTPLRDGPLERAGSAELAAHDPTLLVRTKRAALARARTRFFVSTGPPHSRWAPPAATIRYARELREAGLRCVLRVYSSRAGAWSRQLADGLRWALQRA